MLRIMRQGQRWLTAIFVIGIGAVFVFFMGWGAPSGRQGGDALIQVGPHRYGFREFARARQAREDQYKEALGDQFDADAMAETLDQLAAEALIQRSILALEAEELGLTVSKSEIEREVLASPLFRDEGGRFDPQSFSNWAEWEFGTQRNFMIEHRMITLATKMLRLVQGMAHVSDDEARQAAKRRLEEVRIAFVTLSAGEPPADLEIDAARVQEFLETREEEAQRHYDDHSEQFNRPEQVRARHILLRVPTGADEEEREEVRQRAQEVLERLRAGEDFAELAREISDDPGSKEEGGDLGFFSRGQMLEPFEQAAFALEPGALSEVVSTDFGFHVIRTEEFRPAQHRSYEEAREEIARTLIGEEAAFAEARATAEGLSAEIREGRSLEQAARARELTLERSGWLRRRPDAYIPGIGAAQELMTTAFSLEPGQSSPRIFELEDRLAMVQVLERNVPEPERLEAEVAGQREQLLAMKRDAGIRTWMNARRTALIDAGELIVDLDALR
jgi:peptidyl-prolyl cis-trans isomerase D